MIRWILLIGFFWGLLVSAQEYEPIKSIQAENAQITTDYIGNLYIIQDYRLCKYDSNGKPLFIYEDYKKGKISMVDVSNPMKNVIFYQDNMLITIVDQTLSELATYSLQDLGFYSVSCLAHSRDEDFWIFDNASFQLKKINENGSVIYQSEKFNLLFSENVQVQQIIDFENNVYLLDKQNGIYVFDRMGTFLKKIPLVGLTSFQIIQGIIVYYKDGKLFSYNTQSLLEEEMALPEWLVSLYCQIQKDKIYIIEADRVSIYSFK